MSRLSFRTSGLTSAQRQRWRPRDASPAAAGAPLTAKLLSGLALGAAVVYATSALGPSALDADGNLQASRLLPDAFRGQTIAVLDMFRDDHSFAVTESALGRLGFSIQRWENPPQPAELAAVLENVSQLWIISSREQRLNAEHLSVISDFFDDGGSLFLWGDNEPYYQDANFVARALIGVGMEGNSPGREIVQRQTEAGGAGFLPHPIMVGINNLYEGITIATIDDSPDLEPLVFGSAGNLVVAVYDRAGRRAIVDGGFTRLFQNIETAGTERYIQNAAAWLALN